MATPKLKAAPATARQDYPILKPFRHQGCWVQPSEKTVSLTKAQAVFLLRSGKIGAPTNTAKTENAK